MTRTLVLCCLLTALTASVRGAALPDFAPYLTRPDWPTRTPAPPAAAAEPTNPCERVSFSRGLKYGESEQNVLDVATSGEPDEHISASGAAVRGGRQFCRRQRRTRSRKPDAGRGDVLCRAQRHGRRENEISPGAGQPVAIGRQGRRRRHLLGASEYRPVRRKPRRDRGGRLLRRRISRRESAGPSGIAGQRFRRRRRGAGVGHLPHRRRRQRRRKILFRQRRQQIRRALGVSRHPQHRDAAAARLGRKSIRRASLPRAKS